MSIEDISRYGSFEVFVFVSVFREDADLIIYRSTRNYASPTPIPFVRKVNRQAKGY